MKTKWMVLMLMAGGAMFAETRFSVGVRIGTPAPVVVNAYRSPCPGAGYVWIEGYNDEFGNWIEGYWALPPYAGAYWVAPRLADRHFYAGYWGGGERGVYRAEPRYTPPAAVERDHERAYSRPAPERSERGSRERSGESRQGFRR